MVLVYMIDFVRMCHKAFIHVCAEWRIFEKLEKLQEVMVLKMVLLSIYLEQISKTYIALAGNKPSKKQEKPRKT